MRDTADAAVAPRIRSMLRLDFYRLFHTPALFIMLAISAIVPAMLLSMSGMEAASPDGAGLSQGAVPAVPAVPAIPVVAAASAAPGVEYVNAWQLVESAGESSAGASPLDFAGYANINMVFIFAGLLIAIFVAHDYISGFVKAIFTVHAKKSDYIVSKTAVGVFGGAGMILAYLFGTIIAGLITGKAFDVDLGGLAACIVSKILLMAVFASLFLCVAVFFRNRLWLTVIFTFLFGMMLYPAASVATLNSGVLTALGCLLAGVIGAIALGGVSTFILNKRDLA